MTTPPWFGDRIGYRQSEASVSEFLANSLHVWNEEQVVIQASHDDCYLAAAEPTRTTVPFLRTSIWPGTVHNSSRKLISKTLILDDGSVVQTWCSWVGTGLAAGTNGMIRIQGVVCSLFCGKRVNMASPLASSLSAVSTMWMRVMALIIPVAVGMGTRGRPRARSDNWMSVRTWRS